MPNIDLSILNQRQTPAFYASSLATRPAFGFAGRIFIDTDSPSTGLYRDTGAAWVQIADPGAGTTGTLQQVTTNGNTTNQGISITAGGLSSNIITIAANSIGSTANYIGQTMATNDYWKIYGNAQSVIDTGELVFEIGDNGSSSAVDRFRYTIYDGASLVYKDLLTLDFDESIYNTNLIVSSGKNLGVGVTVPSGLIHADGGASAARMIIDADNGVARIFSFRTDNLPRWALRVDGTETGSNVGGDFTIRRYDDTGAFVDAPLLITRSTGQSTFAKKVVIENNSGDQQLQIVSTTAPSIRLDNIQIGATKRAGLGISTATNNFIQGSSDRDFCMFNGSTTASPILFGIYDTTNVQEAARISAARNFLIGTTTDSGEKLIVSGVSRFNGNITTNSSFIDIGTLSKQAFLYSDTGSGYAINMAANNLGSGSTSPYGRIFFSNLISGSLTTNATIGGFADSSGDSGQLLFFTRASGGSNTQQLAIKSNGNVQVLNGNLLIGTTTDNGNKLQVAGGASLTGSLQINGTYTRAKTLNGTANSSNVILSIDYGFPGAISGTVKVYTMAGIIAGGNLSACVLSFNFVGANNAGGGLQNSFVSNSVISTTASADTFFTNIVSVTASITSATTSGFNISLTNVITGAQTTDPTYYIEVSYGLHGNASIS
jgi:hypothetical protein